MAEETKEVRVLREVETEAYTELLQELQGGGKIVQVNWTKDPKNDRKFPLVAIVPRDEAECQERYKGSEMTLKAKGVSQIGYGINGAVLTALKASDKPEDEIAAEIQKLMDEVTLVATKRTSTAVKAVNKQKVSEYDVLAAEAAEAGISMKDLIGLKIAQLKKGKK